MRVSILDIDGVSLEQCAKSEFKTYIKRKEPMAIAVGCDEENLYLKFKNCNFGNWQLNAEETRGVLEIRMSGKTETQEFINFLEFAVNVLKEMREQAELDYITAEF